jgi:hypothetical protein
MSYALLAVLAIFHIVGAVALGTALRGLWHSLMQGEAAAGSILGHFFLLFWWGLFGCTPMLYGVQPGVELWFFPVQVALWSLTLLLALIFGSRLKDGLQTLFNFSTGLMFLGGLFIAAGLVSTFFALDLGESLFNSVIIGGIFVLLGSGVFLMGLISLFRRRT